MCINFCIVPLKVHGSDVYHNRFPKCFLNIYLKNRLNPREQIGQISGPILKVKTTSYRETNKKLLQKEQN